KILIPIFALAIYLAVFTGCSTTSNQSALAAKFSTATPCMDVLNQFTAADVPAMGPAEAELNPRKPSTNSPPTDLPGNGLAQHPMLYVGEGYNKIFVVNGGKAVWSYSTGRGGELD